MRAFLFTFCLLLCFTTCTKVDCTEVTKMMLDEQCSIVLISQPTKSVWFELNGYDPITQETKVCKTNNRWWNLYADEMEVGDTILKKKGELILYIYKKDSVISHKWKCFEK